MRWEVEFTDEFAAWWNGLTVQEQDSIDVAVDLLEGEGPALRYPWSSSISGSQISHMRELRIQHQGRPYRILYAFDPRRAAILLIGGDKTGDDRWYETYVPIAEKLYASHLKNLAKEGLI